MEDEEVDEGCVPVGDGDVARVKRMGHVIGSAIVLFDLGADRVNCHVQFAFCAEPPARSGIAVGPTEIGAEPATAELTFALSIAGMIHSSAAYCVVDRDGVAPRSETWRVMVIPFGAESWEW